MTQPIALYAEISEPSFLLANFDNDDHDHDDEIDNDHVVDKWGRYLEVEITTVTPPEQQHATSRKRNGDHSSSSSSSSDNECHLLGKLLYELYSGTCPSNMNNDTTDGSIEPARKKSTVRYDKRRYRRRNRIERMFGRLKDWRRVATRYDRCPKVFLSAIALAATVIFWL